MFRNWGIKCVIINRATSRDVTVMVFVRRLVLACLNFNILFRARHVPGVTNVFAASLSRLQVSKFKQLAPVGVQASPTTITMQCHVSLSRF